MLARLVQISNNFKLKHKLIISYILVVMIPVLIVGGLVTAYFRQQALNNAIEQATNNVEKIKTQTAYMLGVPTGISNILLFDEDLKKIAGQRYANVLELTRAYRSYTDFKQYVRQYREISGIRFYVDNPTLINNLEMIPVDESTERSHWYQAAMKASNIGWFYFKDGENENSPVNRLSLVRRISLPDARKNGVLVIQMSQEQLNSMLSQEPFDTYIADEQGYIVAAKNPELVGSTIQDLDLKDISSAENKGAVKRNVKDKPSYVIVNKLTPASSMNGLQIISVFATGSIVEGANRVSFTGLLVIILVLLIALLFVHIVSVLTTRRLLRLSRHFNRLALGDLEVVSRIDGNDEIGQLSRQFNYMVGSINQLMNQVVETNEQNNRLEIAQKEIKLKMMASQINPHFLFNALESIRMNALLKGESEIANIVRLLGKMMRKNLEIGRDHIPLKEELDMVQSYLEIQKFRYEERLTYRLSVDPEALPLMIPPLIIQPLVENSIVHGLENKTEGISVEITIERTENSILIAIKDNGGGMTEERLEEVMRSITGTEESAASRIGLRNVHQRLVMSYGEEHGLKISSEAGSGTLIEFSIPN
ncbi:two-component sensor histidine kinase [Paenibacillus sp. CAA11]|uniref:sensor histidine kinase n=1 Tax=Paenibacillus sp. CAA11 TaxID=1532905 RepID=UPI000D3D64F4|nr:sensor histidine kinase [Paenibacillus sp. CAA11]AWB45481.1 two-component sensor histidine kinase [Paenibacillus sp. CAA11]